MSHKRRTDGLVSKVMKFNLPKDEFGQYIPYCAYQHHRGIVLREFVCIQRNCDHYRRMYFDGQGRAEEPRNDNSNCYGGPQ